MWVVIEQESHPDRFIGDVHGPFDNYDDAIDYAQKINERRPRLWWATVHEVEAP